MSGNSTKELTVRISAEGRDILMALLGVLGYEGFWENEDGFQAYIPASTFDAEALKALLSRQGMSDKDVSVQDLSDQNWNATWESNFPPVQVGTLCQVIAHFHVPMPGFRYTIRITPKMSFGTGHHATTRLMIGAMVDLDLAEKNVLDIGCGTGVLAILASKMGAAHVDAIDIDPWSYDNAKENVEINQCNNVSVFQGDVSAIPERKYDMILANINLNILLQDIPVYAHHLAPDGELLVSGIRPQDLSRLQETAKTRHLTMAAYAEEGNWIMAGFEPLADPAQPN